MIKPVLITGFYRKFNEETYDGRHLGVDIKAKIGDSVKAITDGEVIESREIMGFGGLNPAILGGAVFIRHGEIVALYGHINREVNVGDPIKEGDIIGTIRDFTNEDKINGKYHAPHLHFGIWDGAEMPPPHYGYDRDIKKWIDPIKFLEENQAI